LKKATPSLLICSLTCLDEGQLCLSVLMRCHGRFVLLQEVAT
jgi:hypothetical protein